MKKTLISLALLSLTAQAALAAVSADEAKKLGTTLTATGAEHAGNADKTIPDYTGGLTTAPAGFVKGSGTRPDPFAADKPLYSIKAADLAKYEGKLTAGTAARVDAAARTSTAPARTWILRVLIVLSLFVYLLRTWS